MPPDGSEPLRNTVADHGMYSGAVAVDDYMPARFLLKLQTMVPSMLVRIG